jgi:TetR/AcrR family transcriptional regulator, regulator of cefoperazone and chloramphenicol sensitivity
MTSSLETPKRRASDSGGGGTRGQAARQALLAAGRTVFSAKNLEGATVRDIAEAAGTNVAAISYHFGSKEALYDEVVRQAVEEIRGRMHPVRERLEEVLKQGPPDPEQAIQLIKQVLHAMFSCIVSAEDTLTVSRLVIREQMQPTAAFEHVFAGIGPMHEALSFLVGVAIGEPPTAKETIIRAHSLMGLGLVFRAGRGVILRRLGWTSEDQAHLEEIADLVAEEAEILLRGLRAKKEAERAVAGAQ